MGDAEDTAYSADSIGRISFGWLVTLFLLAFAVRSAWGIYRFSTAAEVGALEFPDEHDYWSIAQSVSAGAGLVGEHGFRALRMPLYPGILSMFVTWQNGVAWAKVFHWFIGALAACLAAVVGDRVGRRRVGIVAGMLVALDPFLIFFSSLLLTETFFVTALCAAWLVGWPLIQGGYIAGFGRWLAVGATVSVCVYLRESSLGLCLCWIGLLVWIQWNRIGQQARRRALAGGMMAVGVLVVALLPWAWRNGQVLGDWIWLTNRGGISLYDGVRPGADGSSDLGAIQWSNEVATLNELDWDRHFVHRSLECIRREPGRIARLAVTKIRRTWNPLPNVSTYQSRTIRWVSAAWTVPVYLLGLWGVYRLRGRKGCVVALLLPAGYVLILHALFVGSVRYRLVAMPMLEILAAYGAVSLWYRTGRVDPVVGPGPTRARS